jgi:ubiquinone/menaquinone biosynthesis C-methylase UbiE
MEITSGSSTVATARSHISSIPETPGTRKYHGRRRRDARAVPDGTVDSYSASSPVGEDERRRMDEQSWLKVDGPLRFALHHWMRSAGGAGRTLTLADIGSGYGAAADLMLKMVQSPLIAAKPRRFRYIAMDSNRELLVHAVNRATQVGITHQGCASVEGYHFDLDTGEGEQPDAAIADIVLLAFVLTHLRGAEEGLREAARLTKRHGIVVVVDTAYAESTHSGDAALSKTITAIQARLRHNDFDRLDAIAGDVGLRRLSGLEDTTQRFGSGELHPKHDGLEFVGNFQSSDEARSAWEEIRGGVLLFKHIRRTYVKDHSALSLISSIGLASTQVTEPLAVTEVSHDEC